MKQLSNSVSEVLRCASAPELLPVRYDAKNLPAEFELETDARIPQRLWSGWIPGDGSPREIVRALSDQERQILSRRLNALVPIFAPYRRPDDDDRVAGAIAAMFDGFPSMRARGQDALAKVASAMDTLRTHPAWAIEAGCESIRTVGYQIDGKTERHWPPSDPEIFAIVTAAAKSRRDALAKVTAILSAPVVPPAPKPAELRRIERPGPTAAELDAALAVTSAEEEREAKWRRGVAERFTKRDDQSIIDQYRERGLEPLRSSSGALVSLTLALSLGWNAPGRSVDGE